MQSKRSRNIRSRLENRINKQNNINLDENKREDEQRVLNVQKKDETEQDEQRVLNVQKRDETEQDEQRVLNIKKRDETEQDEQRVLNVQKRDETEQDEQRVLNVQKRDGTKQDEQRVLNVQKRDKTEQDEQKVLNIQKRDEIEQDEQKVLNVQKRDKTEQNKQSTKQENTQQQSKKGNYERVIKVSEIEALLRGNIEAFLRNKEGVLNDIEALLKALRTKPYEHREPIVEVEELRQYFDIRTESGKKAKLKAVDGVTFQIYKGETFGLVGESGCGKSTLGKSILRLYKLTGGKILFNNEDISEFKGKELKNFRCKSQMIFQDPSSCLNPRRRIKDIMMEPFIIHDVFTPKQREERVLQLCNMVGLSENYLNRFPHEMSGGQKQRVGIARALALNPQFIVCDEAVSALDVSIQAQVINLLEDLQKKLDLTYLFISHNLSVVKHCCQRIGVMYLGKMVELADSESIYKHAFHPYTRALISAIPIADVNVSKQREILKGDIPSPISPPSGCTFHTRCPYASPECKILEPEPIEIVPGHFVTCHKYAKK